jgi:(E)-4-hydroxy-3-methylbut-2-enyl-diphosphate synthase
MIRRRACRVVHVGGVAIGGANPIAVQSMTKTDTRDVEATVAQIRELETCGCDIVRVAVPDMDAARALPGIVDAASIPVIADIHFDYRLAIASVEAGVHGLRLNPGNISNADHIASVVAAAKERQLPIRVGVNAGSLPKESPGVRSRVERMVDAALSEVRLLESLDFEMIKVSLKAFDVLTTVEAYRAIAQRIPYPLHVGITEAGLPWAGGIRSAVGLGALLEEGIGDTLRVSLTTQDVCLEVACAFEILKALRLRERGPTLVSCPTCGRCESDVVGLAGQVEKRLQDRDENIKVAVMGCVVNGPGEARDADVGIACGKGRGVIFKKGQKVRIVEESDYLEALMTEVSSLGGHADGTGRLEESGAGNS